MKRTPVLFWLVVLVLGYSIGFSDGGKMIARAASAPSDTVRAILSNATGDSYTSANPIPVNSSRTFSTTPLTNATGNTTISVVNGTTVEGAVIDLGSGKLPTNLAMLINVTSSATPSLTVMLQQSHNNSTWGYIGNSAGTTQDIVTSWAENATNKWFPVSPVSARYIKPTYVNGGAANDTITGVLSVIDQN